MPLLAVLGPTATGKSDLAMQVARQVGGEIVSADSRQVYRQMDIGTAKPTARDQELVPHHLIDVVDPDGEYSLVVFLRQARAAIDSIHGRGGIPIVAGGSGQYVWALLEGWNVPEVPPDRDFRRDLEARALEEGAAALHRELASLNPASAARVSPDNPRRVIRALEVHRATGSDAISTATRTEPGFKAAIVGLTTERRALYDRIDRRVDTMIAAGWVDEVQRLLDAGYDPGLSSLSSLGYQELARHLAGQLDLAKAVEKIKYRTHRLARRQYAWFRQNDPRIAWHDVQNIEAERITADALAQLD